MLPQMSVDVNKVGKSPIHYFCNQLEELRQKKMNQFGIR